MVSGKIAVANLRNQSVIEPLLFHPNRVRANRSSMPGLGIQEEGPAAKLHTPISSPRG